MTLLLVKIRERNDLFFTSVLILELILSFTVSLSEVLFFTIKQDLLPECQNFGIKIIHLYQHSLM